MYSRLKALFNRKKPAPYIPITYIDCPYCNHSNRLDQMGGLHNKHGKFTSCGKCFRTFKYLYEWE